MLNFKEFLGSKLNEVLEKSYPLIKVMNKSHKCVYEFKTENNRVGSVVFDVDTGVETPFPAEWGVDFTIDKRIVITGEGDAYKIFATVVAAMEDFYKSRMKDIYCLRFISFRAYGNTSREKLYRAIAKRFSKIYNFKVKEKIKSYYVVFRIIPNGYDDEDELEESIKTQPNGFQPLNELFGQEYPFSIATMSQKTGNAYYQFITSQGNVGKIIFVKEGIDIWELEFTIDGHVNVTGTGDAYRIFATVITSIEDFIERVGVENISCLIFTAKRDETLDNPDSRSELYRAIVKRYANQHHYRFNVTKTSDKATFFIWFEGNAHA